MLWLALPTWSCKVDGSAGGVDAVSGVDRAAAAFDGTKGIVMDHSVERCVLVLVMEEERHYPRR